MNLLLPSPGGSYGVHTSLKIPPSAWFDHLTNGCAIALEACPHPILVG
ncbi:hypothetical protein H6G35_27340 [Aulosira sp. FACHB-113]|nr:hypothetical protein [Aulosira sp. FACHB-113]